MHDCTKSCRFVSLKDNQEIKMTDIHTLLVTRKYETREHFKNLIRYSNYCVTKPYVFHFQCFPRTDPLQVVVLELWYMDASVRTHDHFYRHICYTAKSGLLKYYHDYA